MIARAGHSGLTINVYLGYVTVYIYIYIRLYLYIYIYKYTSVRICYGMCLCMDMLFWSV